MQLILCIFFGALVSSTIPTYAAPITSDAVELVRRDLTEAQKELVRQRYAEFNGDLAACRANTNCLVTFYETIPEADLIAYWSSLGTPASSRILADITNTNTRTRSGLRAPLFKGGKSKPGLKPGAKGKAVKKPPQKSPVQKKAVGKKAGVTAGKRARGRKH